MKLKGFTLIELLVVIAIIGVLATVVVGAVNSARTKGADASIKSNLQALRVESELWYDSKNTYASTALSTCPTLTGAAAPAASTTATNFIQGSQPALNALFAVQKQIPSGSSETIKCQASGDKWAVSAPLRVQNQVGTASGQDYWCIDSAGDSRATDLAVTTTACP